MMMKSSMTMTKLVVMKTKKKNYRTSISHDDDEFNFKEQDNFKAFDDEDDDVAIESVREVVAKQNSKVRRERHGWTDCCVE